MLTLFIQSAVILLFCMAFLWLLSIYLKNVSIVDIFWGLGFVIVNAFYFCSLQEIFTRHILLLVLVSIWGLRLTIYLAIRNIGKKEDFRYQEFRKRYGIDRYWWVSFFQVFLLQGFLILIISLPLLGTIFYTKSNDLIGLDYLAILIWVVGFIFESIGDFQLTKFKNNPNNKGKVLDKGLWKYTRHPNYFGDTLVWWAYAIFSISSGSYWPIIGSLIMTILIIKVSGVSLLEKTLKNKKPGYEEYIRKTNSFFPWFPKK